MDTRIVDASDWDEVYDVYIQDIHDLGTKDWFNENSPWSRQTMIARLLEASRKEYWDPSDEVMEALAQEYQESVETYGPCCCVVCCGNPLLDSYTKGILKPGEIQEDSSSSITSRSTHNKRKYLQQNRGEEDASNQSTSNPGGVGMTGNEANPQSKSGETSESNDDVKGKVMTEMETISQMPVSGAPLMAIVILIVVLGLVGAGLWYKRH